MYLIDPCNVLGHTTCDNVDSVDREKLTLALVIDPYGCVSCIQPPYGCVSCLQPDYDGFKAPEALYSGKELYGSADSDTENSSEGIEMSIVKVPYKRTERDVETQTSFVKTSYDMTHTYTETETTENSSEGYSMTSTNASTLTLIAKKRSNDTSVDRETRERYDISGPMRAKERLRAHNIQKRRQLEATRAIECIHRYTVELERKRRLEDLRELKRNRVHPKIRPASKVSPSSSPSQSVACTDPIYDWNSKHSTEKTIGLQNKVSVAATATAIADPSSHREESKYLDGFQRLYELSKSKQIAGKQRREGITMAKKRAHTVPTQSQVKISLTQAIRISGRMYDRGMKQRVTLDKRKTEAPWMA